MMSRAKYEVNLIIRPLHIPLPAINFLSENTKSFVLQT